MDWNSDGEPDIISGDRSGYLNVFLRFGNELEDYRQHPRTMQYWDNFGVPMNVGANSEPDVFDWNDDGKKDLVIGDQSYEIRLYLNQGSDVSPEFGDYSTIAAGGSQIRLYRVNPYIFDLNGDGRKDLICGEQNGYVHFYENLGPDSAPQFAAGETLKLVNGTPVRWTRNSYYYGSRCGFGDWNNDEVPDFLMSTYEGQIELYLGQSTDAVAEGNPATLIHELLVAPSPGPAPIRVSFSLSRPADVRIEIVDRLGRTVRHLGTAAAIEHRSVEWDGTDDEGRQLAAGVYFCRLAAGEDTKTGRLVLSR